MIVRHCAVYKRCVSAILAFVNYDSLVPLFQPNTIDQVRSDWLWL